MRRHHRGEPKKTALSVEFGGVTHSLEIAHTTQQLIEAKALDDVVFNDHLGITMDELTEIMNHGAVLLLRDFSGRLIGESQVITSPISQHADLDEDEAYNYGTAVHPEQQNNGVAQILFVGQDIIAKEAGKTRSTLTVRLENAQSLRGRFKAGFHVVGYDPTHYGPVEDDGARLIMEKKHNHQNQIFEVAPLILAVNSGDVIVVDEVSVDDALQEAYPIIGIKVKSGDEIDIGAHRIVSKIFESGRYKGVGLLKPTEVFLEEGESSLLVLKKHN